MAKPSRSSPLAWIKTHKLLSGLVIIILVLVGVVAYEKIALYQNKRAFLQARIAIDEVYNDIVQQVGQPDNYKRSNTCSRSYQEFTGYGAITCEVRSEFIYGLSNEDEANRMLREIQSVISQHKSFKMTKPLTKSIEDAVVLDTPYHTSHDYYQYKSLGCINSYIFDTPRILDLHISDKSKKAFEISFSCSGPASKQYYPLDT